MRRVLAWLERALARRTGEADVYPFWLRSGQWIYGVRLDLDLWGQTRLIGVADLGIYGVRLD